MFALLILTICTLALSNAAPAQQLLYGGPAAAAVLRLDAPVLQPIVAASPTPALYFSPPGYPFVYQLRQNQGGFNNTQFNEILQIFQQAGASAQETIGQLQGWGEGLGQGWGMDWGGLLPTGGNKNVPASTMELKSPEEMSPEMKIKMAEWQRFYYPAYPQFYQNYNFVPNPVIGVQPLQVIRARNIAEPIPIKNDKFLAQVIPGSAEVSEGVVPAGTVPLAEPLKSYLEPKVDEQVAEEQQKQQPIVDGVVIAAADAAQPAAAFAKFLRGFEARVPKQQQIPIEVEEIAERALEISQDASVVKEVEGSVAQAAPEAAAIAGKAGTAEASPLATAIVGKDGLAVAQPVASAVSGEFGSALRSNVDVEKQQQDAAPKIQVE